ncbi:MAG: hypothetical protein ACKVS9_17460 [Phycisphaerae bacterium]
MSTLMMTGLIWMVQVVHYPLFANVGEGAFCDYEHQHTRRITWLVGPLMLTEGASAAALMLLLAPGTARVLAIIGVLLLVVNWGSTAFLQVPCHTRLSRGFDREVVRRLVSTNWIRTVAWSVRGALAVTLVEVVHR